MSYRAKVCACAVAYVAVMAWAILHQRFDGASVLALLLIGVSVVVLLAGMPAPEGKPKTQDCPHCGNPLGPWVDPAKRRGDGI